MYVSVVVENVIPRRGLRVNKLFFYFYSRSLNNNDPPSYILVYVSAVFNICISFNV